MMCSNPLQPVCHLVCSTCCLPTQPANAAVPTAVRRQPSEYGQRALRASPS